MGRVRLPHSDLNSTVSVTGNTTATTTASNCIFLNDLEFNFPFVPNITQKKSCFRGAVTKLQHTKYLCVHKAVHSAVD